MKRLILKLLLFAVILPVYGEVTERGTVKEYHGKEAKTALPGVELMIKGAPSTVSDSEGNFALRFATLSPGEKVDCTEIYKEGFVIFNKDALEAWRISNDGRPFTIVMCRESDFRALKKKFYGIIEKSYREEYEREKAKARSSAENEAMLNEKLRAAEKAYNEKISDINTYVELFSRIDRNEMDSIESRSIELLETGDIRGAISAYEELRLTRQIEKQTGKWDAAIEMRRAADGMESQAKADLVMLVEKLQKQLGLYEMGGEAYGDKRRQTIEDLIALMSRLNPVTGGSYSENIGRLLLMRSKDKPWNERVADLRQAAAIPSAIGLWALADYSEISDITSGRLTDSIRCLYRKAIEIAPADSVRQSLETRLAFIPEGYFKSSDNNTYPYNFAADSSVIITGCNYYFSAPLRGVARIPSEIEHHGRKYPVKTIQTYAFLNNPELRKIILPENIVSIGSSAFDRCQALDTIIAGPNITQFPETLSLGVEVLLPHGTKDANWVLERAQQYFNSNQNTSEFLRQRNTLIRALIDFADKTGQKEWGENMAFSLADGLFALGDTVGALSLAEETVRRFKPYGYTLAGNINRICGNKNEEVKCFEKAMKLSPVIAGNSLAYIYAKPEYGRRNRKKALEYIEKAIAACPEDSPERPNLLDSKGEILIMFGDEDQARQIHDHICRKYPDFFAAANSGLHAHFSAAEAPADTIMENETTEKQSTALRENNIQNYIDVVQAIAQAEHRKFNMANLIPAPSYEEFLSIGIIAVQALIKDKTPEQLERYNSAYISAAIKWAIRNEMAIRHDWYNVTPPGRFDNAFNIHKDLIASKDYSASNLKTVLYIYTALRDLHYNLNSGSAANKEVDEIWDIIMSGKSLIGDNDPSFYEYMTSPDAPDLDIFETYDINTITGTIALLRESMRSANHTAYGIKRGLKDNSTYNKEDESKELQSLIPDCLKIAQDAGEVIRQRIGDLNIEPEEIMSIGIIALNSMIKSCTAEYFKSLSPFYIYSAICMGIHNELSVRYPQKVRDFKAPGKYSRTEGKLVLIEYLKNLYYHCLETSEDSDLARFASERFNAINERISGMSAEAGQAGRDLMKRDSTAADIINRHSEEAANSFISELGDLVKFPIKRSEYDK